MQPPFNDLEDINEDDFLSSIGDTDFVFVLDSSGGLKTLLLPDEYDKGQVPENITTILKVFGVTDLEPVTLH